MLLNRFEGVGQPVRLGLSNARLVIGEVFGNQGAINNAHKEEIKRLSEIALVNALDSRFNFRAGAIDDRPGSTRQGVAESSIATSSVIDLRSKLPVSLAQGESAYAHQ